MYTQLLPNQNPAPSFFQQIFKGLFLAKNSSMNWETAGIKKDKIPALFELTF